VATETAETYSGIPLQLRRGPFPGLTRARSWSASTFAYSSEGARCALEAAIHVSKDELYVFFNTASRDTGDLGALRVRSTDRLRPSRSRGRDPAGPLAGRRLSFRGGDRCCAVEPEAWWARLSPQIWLVPVILAMPLSSAAVGSAPTGRRPPHRHPAGERASRCRTQLVEGSREVARLQGPDESTEDCVAAGPLEVTIHPSFRMITEHRLRSKSIIYTLVRSQSALSRSYFSFPLSARAAACPAGQ